MLAVGEYDEFVRDNAATLRDEFFVYPTVDCETNNHMIFFRFKETQRMETFYINVSDLFWRNGDLVC